MRWIPIILAAVAVRCATGQTASQVLVVINGRSPVSREIGEYYVQKRAIPRVNVCTVDTKTDEVATRAQYETEIEAPIAAYLKAHRLTEQVLYIVLTKGVPLKIPGPGGGLESSTASVDSELTLLYGRMRGVVYPLAGAVHNPFFRNRDTPFRHPIFPIYLVTRLDGYDMHDMKALVDRALQPRAAGKFVIDLKANDRDGGNEWLRAAALLLPPKQVLLDDSAVVLQNIKDVIGYASWGSNDTARKQRFLHFGWLPGAIATDFVSTNARSFSRPPDTWELGGKWGDPKTSFMGSPQSMTADYIHEGASGASGQVDEPYLQFCPRPEFVLPAYAAGRTLAESFYMGIPGLSWMNVVIGDPLMTLR